MFTLSSDQFALFEDHARAQWCQTAAHDLFAAYPAHYAAFGASAEQLVPMVQATVAWAQRHGINSQAECTRVCHVAASLGHRFWQDPRFQRYVTASTAPDIAAGRHATVLTRETKAWLRGVWAGDCLQAFSERLAERLRAGHGAQAGTLAYILPGHWRMFTAADNDQFLSWLLQSAPDGVRQAGPGQLAYAACALVHGPQWMSDPQYPRLAQAVRAETDPADLAMQITDIYTQATA